jgi:hypothetical protein
VYCCYSGILLTVTTHYLYVLFLLTGVYDVSFSIKENNVGISYPRPGFGMDQLLDRFLWPSQREYMTLVRAATRRHPNRPRVVTSSHITPIRGLDSRLRNQHSED